MKIRSSETVSLFNSAFAIMQRDIFVYILNILTGVVVARTLGPEMLGIWVLLSLVSAYAEGFGRLKTDISSVYILGSGKAKPEEVLFSTTFFSIITSLIIVLLMLWQLEFIEDLLFKATDVSYSKELICIIFLIPFEFLLLNYSYFFVALENIVVYNRIKILQATLNFSTIVLLILLLDFKLWALVLARISSISIPLIYAWLSLDKKDWAKLRTRWNGSVSFKILSYAFNFYVIGIIGNIHTLTIKSIAAVSFNASQLAFYNQGEAASKLINVIPNSISVILYPRISKLGKKEAGLEISCISFRVILTVLVCIGIALVFIANPLIIMLYGIAFEPTAEVLKLAIPGVVIGSSCLSLSSYFEGSGQASIIPKLQIMPVILQIVFAYFLIDSWGLIGAAIAFSLGSALYGIVVLIAFIRINRLPVSKIIPQIEDVKLIYSVAINKIKEKT